MEITCILPISLLSIETAKQLVGFGQHVVLIDDFGRCKELEELVLTQIGEPKPNLNVADVKPFSKQAQKLIKRCKRLVVAYEPREYTICPEIDKVILGFILEALRQDVEHIMVTLPAGVYAYHGVIDCRNFPSRPYPSSPYLLALAAATLALASRRYTIVVIPTLIHDEPTGPVEQLNWVEYAMRERIGLAPEDAKLTILHYKDCARVIARIITQGIAGFVCVKGVTLTARDVYEALGVKEIKGFEPHSVTVEAGLEPYLDETKKLLRKFNLVKE